MAGQVVPVTTVPTAACTIRYALLPPVQVGNVMGLVALKRMRNVVVTMAVYTTNFAASP